MLRDKIKRHVECAQRGATLVFCAISILLLIICCAIAIDVAQAMTKQANNRAIIEVACEQKMSPSQTAYIKNLNDPGEYIAKSIMSQMRESGLQDKIVITFYEVSKYAIEGRWRNFSPNNRVYVYSVCYQTGYVPMFLPGEFDLPLAVRITKVANPYAEINVWRPTSVDTDYAYVAKEYTLMPTYPVLNVSVKNLTSGTLPQAVVDALNNAFDTIDPRHPGMATVDPSTP